MGGLAKLLTLMVIKLIKTLMAIGIIPLYEIVYYIGTNMD